jgi:signal peptidase I
MRNPVEFTRRILQTRGYIRIPSKDAGMEPLIRAGDICHYEPVRSFRELKKGDILLYVSAQGELVSRRFIGTKLLHGETRIICKGDDNRHPDEPIDVSQVIGKMEHRSLGMKLWGKLIAYFPFMSALVQKLYKRKSSIDEKQMASDHHNNHTADL